MTETEYFTALHDLLDARLRKAPHAAGGRYDIQEPGQEAFFLDPKNLTSHFAIALEKLPGNTWPFFKLPHAHAHRRCDCIVVSWCKTRDVPIYLLVELKSGNTNGAALQLKASLAFCHFAHRMLSVKAQSIPEALYGAVTVKKLPFALKRPSLPSLPSWQTRGLQKDCSYMVYDRSTATLPLWALIKNLT